MCGTLSYNHCWYKSNRAGIGFRISVLSDITFFDYLLAQVGKYLLQNVYLISRVSLSGQTPIWPPSVLCEFDSMLLPLAASPEATPFSLRYLLIYLPKLHTKKFTTNLFLNEHVIIQLKHGTFCVCACSHVIALNNG